MAIAHVQDVGAAINSATTASVSGTFTAGNLLVIKVSWGTSAGAQSIAQSGTDSWTLIDTANNGVPNYVHWTGYIKNWKGGALATTFTESGGSGTDGAWVIMEFSGADTTAPLSSITPATANTSAVTAQTTGTMSGTTNSTDLLVGLMGYTNGTSHTHTVSASSVPSTGWTFTTQQDGTLTSPHGHAYSAWNVLSATATNPVFIATASAAESGRNTIACFVAAAAAATTASVTYGYGSN